MKTRIIYTKIWSDEYFRTLNEKEQNIFLFLLFNDRVNMCGIYEFPDWMILAFRKKIKDEDLQKIKTKLQHDCKFIFLNGWVRIVNNDKYNKYTGTINEKVVLKELNDCPKEIKEYPLDTLSIGYEKGIDTLHNNKSLINNKKVVKGTEFACLESLTDEVVKTVADEYSVDFNWAKRKVKDIELYCQRNGKTYRNYKATLQTWIRTDIEKGTARKAAKPAQIISPPETIKRTPEEIARSNAMMEKIREDRVFLTKHVSVNSSPIQQ